MTKIEISIHAFDVMSNRKIRKSWVEEVVKSPSVTFCIDENEMHLYGTIKENDGRCLKVIFNPLTNVVITAFFDRKMRKKGCT